MPHSSRPAPRVKPTRYADASEWPPWTDRWVFEPSPEERGAAAALFEEAEVSRTDRVLGLMMYESLATDALTAGLIPPDVAAEILRTSNVGHDA
jgi:hypothetical protein